MTVTLISYEEIQDAITAAACDSSYYDDSYDPEDDHPTAEEAFDLWLWDIYNSAR